MATQNNLRAFGPECRIPQLKPAIKDEIHRFLSLCKEYQDKPVLLVGHLFPDCDAIATSFVLRRLLPRGIIAFQTAPMAHARKLVETLGISKTMVQDVPPSFPVILCDASVDYLIKHIRNRSVLAVIDHHYDPTVPAPIRVIDPDSCSSGLLAYSILVEATNGGFASGLIGRETALAIVASMVSDCGLNEITQSEKLHAIVTDLTWVANMQPQDILEIAIPKLPKEDGRNVTKALAFAQRKRISTRFGDLAIARAVTSYDLKPIVADRLVGKGELGGNHVAIVLSELPSNGQETYASIRLSRRFIRESGLPVYAFASAFAEELGGKGGGHSTKGGAVFYKQIDALSSERLIIAAANVISRM